MDMTWAEKLASLQSRGWGLTALAEAIGTSPQALSDIKQGRSKEPRGMTAVQLHHLFSTGATPPRKSAGA